MKKWIIIFLLIAFPCFSSQKVIDDLIVTGETATTNWAPNVTIITNADSPFTLDDGVILLCDTSGGAITVNLPALSAVTDRVYHIKLINAASHVTVQGAGSGSSADKIDAASKVTIQTIWTSISIVDGGNSAWFIF